MSEELSRDPLVQKLTRFTPAAGGIDRDALLFSAGRASAPGTGRWRMATAVLAGLQVMTLGLWFAGPSTPRPQWSGIDVAIESPLAPGPQPLLREPEPAGSYGSLVRSFDGAELPPAEPVADPLPPHPILTVATSRGALDLD